MDKTACAVLIMLAGGKTLSAIGKVYGCTGANVLEWLKTRQPSFREIRPRKFSGASAKSALLNRYRGKAKKRGIPWALTEEQFFKLVTEDCEYCGQPPEAAQKADSIKGESFLYNGIDRIDNKLGYEKTNCAPCCRWCNQSKSILTVDEFKNLISRQFRKLVGGNGCA